MTYNCTTCGEWIGNHLVMVDFSKTDLERNKYYCWSCGNKENDRLSEEYKKRVFLFLLKLPEHEIVDTPKDVVTIIEEINLDFNQIK